MSIQHRQVLDTTARRIILGIVVVLGISAIGFVLTQNFFLYIVISIAIWIVGYLLFLFYRLVRGFEKIAEK